MLLSALVSLPAAKRHRHPERKIAVSVSQLERDVSCNSSSSSNSSKQATAEQRWWHCVGDRPAHWALEEKLPAGQPRECVWTTCVRRCPWVVRCGVFCGSLKRAFFSLRSLPSLPSLPSLLSLPFFCLFPLFPLFSLFSSFFSLFPLFPLFPQLSKSPRDSLGGRPANISEACEDRPVINVRDRDRERDRERQRETERQRQRERVMHGNTRHSKRAGDRVSV
jgi:hypothetical protein